VSEDWISADWPAPDNIVAGTTLRTENKVPVTLFLEENRVTGTLFRLNQVHGADVVLAGRFLSPPDADASVSRDPAHVCVVRTADCLPVLFCSADGSEFAAAHAGWRGLAAGVLENTVAALRTDAGDLMVWMGPAISQANFEVGGEVRDAFLGHDEAAETCFEANARGRWQADLYGLARQRLASIGVEAVYGGGWCTFTEPERFFSYRRDKDAGRMLSFVSKAR